MKLGIWRIVLSSHTSLAAMLLLGVVGSAHPALADEPQVTGPDVGAVSITFSPDSNGIIVEWTLDVTSGADVTPHVTLEQIRNGQTVGTLVNQDLAVVIGLNCPNCTDICATNHCAAWLGPKLLKGVCRFVYPCSPPIGGHGCLCDLGPSGAVGGVAAQAGDIFKLTVTPPAGFNDANPANNVLSVTY